MELDSHLRNDSCFRGIQTSETIPPISCGFILKPDLTEDCTNEFYNRFALIYVLRGEGSYIDHHHMSHPLKEGSVFIRHPNYRHSNTIVPDGKWAECFISLPSSFVPALHQLKVLQDNVFVWHPGLKKKWVQQFEKILAALKTAEDRALPKIQWDIVQFLLDVGQYAHSQNTLPFEEKTILYQACERLRRHSTSREPLPQLLNNFGLSYSRLRALFREQFSCSPGEYQVRHRMERACTLLIGSQLSIKEVALRLGYSDPYTFSKQFKKWMKKSPKRFRKEE